MNTTDTDWITPGAEIVVYSRRSDGSSHPRKTTVKTRAKQSFTVEGIGDRFKLDTLETKPTDGWTRRRWVVVHPDSEQARSLFDAARKADLQFKARTTVEAWQKDRTRENRLAAIEALQAVED